MTDNVDVLIGTELDDYSLESALPPAQLSCWCDHRLGTNKSEHRPKYDLSPRIWTKTIGNSRLIHHSESNVVKAKEGDK